MLVACLIGSIRFIDMNEKTSRYDLHAGEPPSPCPNFLPFRCCPFANVFVTFRLLNNLEDELAFIDVIQRAYIDRD